LEADLDKDLRIHPDEILNALYKILYAVLDVELAKRDIAAMRETFMKKYDCLKDNKDLKELIELVTDEEDMKKMRDFIMVFYDT
jgi:hypothetical protein